MDLKNWNRFLLDPVKLFREKEGVDLSRGETETEAGTQEAVLKACRPWQLFSVPGKRRPPMRSFFSPAH